MRRRVKITGIGPVTAAGIGREFFWRGILESKSRVRPFRRLDEEFGPFAAAEVTGFNIDDYFDDVAMRRLPRHTQFALAAWKLAIEDGNISVEELKDKKTAVLIGASLMDFEYTAKTIANVARKGAKGAVAKAVFHAPVSSISTHIAKMLGAQSMTMAIQSSCCAGADSIGHAAELVSSGQAEIAICGGTEAPLLQCPLYELKLVGMAPNTEEDAEHIGRPFDLWRTTGVVGEGACVVILEPEESVRPAYAYLDGYAYAADGAVNHGNGLEKSIVAALANARLSRAHVEHVCAWGPGHRKIDAAEAAALGKVFGNYLKEIPVTSIKGAIGNPLGAAGAIQTAVAALSLKHGEVPPTVNWQYPDPSCPLNLSGRSRRLNINNAIVNSHGLSGTNACLALRRT